MEKVSVKLAFLVLLALVALCLSFCEARDMAREELNCLGGCPPNHKHCNCKPEKPPVVEDIATNASCHRDKDCVVHCPKGCKIVNCMSGKCFCEC